MKNKPHVIFIQTDQHQYKSLGCYGNKVIQTPNIDNLAENGLLFEQHYTVAPVCAPSRVSLFTSTYPSENDCMDNGHYLNPEVLTLAEHFRRNGYQTSGFGKFHFEPQYKDGWFEEGNRDECWADAIPKKLPYYGFEEVEVLEDPRKGPYDAWLKARGYTNNEDLDSAQYPQARAYTSAYPEELYQTTYITDQARKCLSGKDPRTPQFFYLSFTDPHHPFHVPAPFDTLYNPNEIPLPSRHPSEIENNKAIKRFYYAAKNGESGHCFDHYEKYTDYDWKRIIAHYYGKISLIDKQVGRLVDTLKEKGMFEDSIIVFTADHGEHLGAHWLLTKGFLTNDQVFHIPLIISWPDKLESGLKVKGMCENIDLYPSLCDLCGLRIPMGIRGRSMMPIINHPEAEFRDEVYTECNQPLAIRTKEFLLISVPDPDDQKHNEYYLYNLKKDPEQFFNVWNNPEYNDIRVRLLDRMLIRRNAAGPSRTPHMARW